MAKPGVMKTCRSIHSWLGIFVFPWVIIIGLTGVYLNHSRPILSVIGQSEFSESQFDKSPNAVEGTQDRARSLADEAWKSGSITGVWEEDYHGRPSIMVEKEGGLTILSIPTGHYYLKTRYTRRTFSPDGQLLHTKYYLGGIFKDLHTTGWLGGALGTWISDIVGMVLAVFGITGSIMWSIPKFRKLRSILRNRY